jgi:hypothetical protein
VVQFTLPGTACSVAFGSGIGSAPPGSVDGTELVVNDIEAARAELTAAGVEVSEPFHRDGAKLVPGPDPERRSYLSYATFNDPDGNGWLLQEITTPLPAGRRRRSRSTARSKPWPTRCAERRRRTAGMKPRSVRPTRTGPTGTPSTWRTRGEGPAPSA